MFQPHQFICAGLMALGCGLASAADVPGYVVDSRGEPMRSASGDCARTGNWTSQTLHPACDSKPAPVPPDRIVLLLVALGTKTFSLDAAGRGEREPLVATADGVAEPKNRRVEISVRLAP